MFVFKKQHNLPPPNPLHFTVCHKPTNRTFLTIHRDHTSHTRLHEKYSAALLQQNIVNTRPPIQPTLVYQRWQNTAARLMLNNTGSTALSVLDAAILKMPCASPN